MILGNGKVMTRELGQLPVGLHCRNVHKCNVWETKLSGRVVMTRTTRSWLSRDESMGSSIIRLNTWEAGAALRSTLCRHPAITFSTSFAI